MAPVKERRRRPALSRRVSRQSSSLSSSSSSLRIRSNPRAYIHSLSLSLAPFSPLPASFQRLFISPTPISLPGKYLQELATIDDYLVNSLLCGEVSQHFPRACPLPLPVRKRGGGGGGPAIPCLFLIRPFARVRVCSNFCLSLAPFGFLGPSRVRETNRWEEIECL